MRTKLAAWFEVTKPRVVALIVFTALIGMLLSVPGAVPAGPLVFGTLGIWLAAASAAALNQLIDRRTDAQMSRTAQRPLPTGVLTEREVLVLALVLGNASMLLLWWLVNPLTAVLTFCSLIGYAVIYTVWLKHATPQNIVIGGAAGAAPPLLGWCSCSGSCCNDDASTSPCERRVSRPARLARSSWPRPAPSPSPGPSQGSSSARVWASSSSPSCDRCSS